MRNENKIHALCAQIVAREDLMLDIMPYIPEDPTEVDILELIASVLHPNAKMVHFELTKSLIEMVDAIFDDRTEFGEPHMKLAVMAALVYFKE